MSKWAESELAKPGEYSRLEMMAVQAARLIVDGETVFVGTGLPMIAAFLAKASHAPNAVVFTEAGYWDPQLLNLPGGVQDARWYPGITWRAGQSRMFALLQRKLVDVGFLGGAQIDRYGNLNSTGLGISRAEDGLRYTKRFEGAGGAIDIASMANSTIIILSHERRRFVERVDYLTSPGWYVWLHDYQKRKGRIKLVPREELGMWGGPRAVVSTLGVMKFGEETKEMYLASYYSGLGVTVEEVQASTSFDMDVSKAEPSIPPTKQELELLRQRIDPEGLFMRY